jgi:hypothetical protein
MLQEKQRRQQKNSNEKPISLHPLEFDEALRDLLAAKPPKVDKKREKKEVLQKKT